MQKGSSKTQTGQTASPISSPMATVQLSLLTSKLKLLSSIQLGYFSPYIFNVQCGRQPMTAATFSSLTAIGGQEGDCTGAAAMGL